MVYLQKNKTMKQIAIFLIFCCASAAIFSACDPEEKIIDELTEEIEKENENEKPVKPDEEPVKPDEEPGKPDEEPVDISSLNLFYFYTSMDFGAYKHLPTGIWKFQTTEENGKTYDFARAADGTIAAAVPNPNESLPHPVLHFADQHRSVIIEPWNEVVYHNVITGEKKIAFRMDRNELQCPNINILEQNMLDIDEDTPPEAQVALTSMQNQMSAARQFMVCYDAYRNFPDVRHLTDMGKETIAGVECTKWECDQPAYLGVQKQHLTLWADDNGNCFKLHYKQDGNGTEDEMSCEVIDYVPECNNVDDIIAHYYEPFGEARPVEDYFLNVYTEYNNRWVEEKYGHTFAGTRDWHIVYEDLTIDEDVLPIYDGSGTIEHMIVGTDHNSLYNGTFKLEISINGATIEDARAYMGKIRSLRYYADYEQDNYDNGEIVSLRGRSGDEMSVHPDVDFGTNQYIYPDYTILYMSSGFNGQNGQLIIKISIVRMAIV